MSKIKTLYFGITNKCNFNCKYCYAKSDHKSSELSLLEIENYLIPWIRDGGFSVVSFDGGEPLTALDRLVSIMKLIQDQTSINEFQFVSNGSLVSEKVLEKLETVTPNIMFTVSVDTVDPELDLRSPHFLPEVLENVEFLNDRGKLLAVLSTVTAGGFEKAEGLFKHFENTDILVYADVMLPHAEEQQRFVAPIDELKRLDKLMFDYAFNPAFFSSPTAINPDVWEQYKPLLEEAGIAQFFGCTMFRYDNCVRPNGSIKPCQICDVVLGNVKSMTYDQLMQHDWVKRMIALDMEGKCSSCAYIDSCHGGCRARAFVESGDYFGEIESCEIDHQTGHHINENVLTERFERAIQEMAEKFFQFD